MVSILLTADGDLDLSRGGLQLIATDSPEAIAQRVRTRIRHLRGEWFLDPSRGVPYFQTILVTNPNMAHIREAYRSVILGTKGVVRLNSLVLTFDRRARTLSVRARVNGDVLITEPITL